MIKEVPVTYRTYYKSMKVANSSKLQVIEFNIDKVSKSLKEVYVKVKDNIKMYKTTYNIILNNYEEFINNTYDTGKFLRAMEIAYVNKDNNYELDENLYLLFKLANGQRIINDLLKERVLVKKLIALPIEEYREILRKFYTEVHRQMILNGNGYVFENKLGWTCINRCHIVNPKPRIDFAATKKREQELKEQNKRIYNQKEAEWCEKNNIEYKSNDKRVFLNNEYCYELPIIHSMATGGCKLRLTCSDYRHVSLRGKTNDEILASCNGDKEKVCNLSIDLKTKIAMCVKLDDHLYTKFIRNENQRPYKFSETDR